MRTTFKTVMTCLVSVALILISSGVIHAGGTRTWKTSGGTPDNQRYSMADVDPPLVELWDTGGQGSVWGSRPILTTKYAYLGFAEIIDPETYEFNKRVEKRNLADNRIVWEYNDAWNIWGYYNGDLIVQGFEDDLSAWVRRIDGGDRHTVWEIRWQRTTRKTCVDEDYAYSLSYFDNIDNERSYLLHAFDLDNGRLMWMKKFKQQECANTGFCIWEDHLYGSVGKQLFKLNKSTGAEVWSVSLKERLPLNSFITADENGVIFTTINDELRKISHEDGSEIWSYKLSSYQKEEDDDTPSGAPGIMGGKIYVQSRGCISKDEHKAMYCIDSSTGEVVWKTELPGTSVLANFDIGHHVSCTNDAIFCVAEAPGSKDTQLTSFNPDNGDIIWTDEVDGVIFQDELAVTSGYLVAQFLEHLNDGSHILNYRCWTNVNVDKPKLALESDKVSFGTLYSMDKVTKDFKVWSETDSEIIGTVSSSAEWLTVTPTSFSGLEQNFKLIANPTYLSEGPAQATLTFKTNGGNREVTISIILALNDQIDRKSFNLSVPCSGLSDWNHIVTLEGFQKGDISSDIPWLIAGPDPIMGEDIGVVFKVNPSLVDGSNLSGQASIQTNKVEYTYTITIEGIPVSKEIYMWIDNPESKINGEVTTIDPPPTIIGGRTMIPLRFTGEALDITFEWDGETRTVSYDTIDGERVVLGIGNTKATIAGKQVTVEPPAQIINDRTVVPVRFISESLGARVEWFPDERKVGVFHSYCR